MTLSKGDLLGKIDSNDKVVDPHEEIGVRWRIVDMSCPSAVTPEEGGEAETTMFLKVVQER